LFEAPPFGKDVQLDNYSAGDCALLLMRYLMHIPEPIIPVDSYTYFRPASPFVEGILDEKAKKRQYAQAISELPHPRRELLLYLLDLLHLLVTRESNPAKAASDMAQIFQRAVLKPPVDLFLLTDEENRISASVLTYMIENSGAWLLSERRGELEGIVARLSARWKTRQSTSTR
jgi:hypothetical protein